MPDKPFDLALLGGTGYTGRLTARYLAEHVPAGCSLVLAGRNEEKLEALRDELAAINPELGEELVLVFADTGHQDSLDDLAANSRVLISTVGPYVKYGEPVVGACARAGTDYVDLTGEPEFVDTMYVKYHALAKETGARLVHCCGFDSVPHDLGVYATVGALPDDVPIRVDGYLRAGGSLSGGTLESAVTAFSRVRQMRHAAAARRRAEPAVRGRRIRVINDRPRKAGDGKGGWAAPLPTIDPEVVRASARQLDRYGPDFGYAHHVVVKRLPVLAGLGAGAGGLAVAAQIPPLRRWLTSRKPAGQGPTEEQRAKGWFAGRYVGEGGGERVVTEVSGGDPGYGETAKMLSECALALAYDELPATAGQVTTAVAMGDALIARLRAAGITIETRPLTGGPS